MMDGEGTTSEGPSRSSRPGEGPGDGDDGVPRSSVELIDATGRLGEQAVLWVRDRAADALAHLGASGSVTVRVVADDEMARVHLERSGIEGTTDVLTFDMRDDERGPLETDLIVCLDEAARRAGELGHDVGRELLLYVVHGVLHCMGHDDHDEADAARMHAVEDETLDAIGVGAVYAPPVERRGQA